MPTSFSLLALCDFFPPEFRIKPIEKIVFPWQKEERIFWSHSVRREKEKYMPTSFSLLALCDLFL